MAGIRALLQGTLVIVACTACGSSPSAHTTPPSPDASAPDTGATTEAGAATESLWVVPASLDDLSDLHVYDHPWPSDLRRDPSGAIHLAGFYNPHLVPLIDDYIMQMTGRIQGFSPVATGYLRFTGDIDPTSLPVDPPHSALPASGVQLVDVDPASPDHGTRRMLETFWQQPAGVYWLADTLAVRPALGYPLRPKTRYALVVTSAVRAASGGSLAPSADLREVLGLAPIEARVQAAHDLYAPALTELAALGIAASDVVHLAVFTTNDPVGELFAIADDVHANVVAPAAVASAWTANEQTADYDVYQGQYGPSPNYQQGTPPYSNTGGDFVFDAMGHPVVQNTFPQTFCLVVPNAMRCPMPATGYPIVLYAHGTGGNYRSIVDENNSFGQLMAQNCLASMGINQIFAGDRPGAPAANDPNYESDEDLLFFNLNNPLAARANPRQAAADVVQQARLFTDTHLTVPASVSRTQAAIAFDSSKLLFIGHSEGGLNGPMFLAADNQARGGVLSGAGAMITIALHDKTQPSPGVAALVRAFLGLVQPQDAAELNLFHPALNFAQTIVDPADPVHYARYEIAEPRAGFAPKSLLVTEGVLADGTGDSYAPPAGIEVHAVALGLGRQAPGVHVVPEAAWGGLADVTVPAGGLSGNLASGRASGVLSQFAPLAGDDGHFVAFDVPAAHTQVGAFCVNLAADPAGRVPSL
jgi:hypothetical protein